MRSPLIRRACPFCGEVEHLRIAISIPRPIVLNGAVPLDPREPGGEAMEEVDGVCCDVCDASAPLDMWNGTRSAHDLAVLRDFNPPTRRAAA